MTATPVTALVAALDGRLRESGTPERAAAQQQAHPRGDLTFYGVVAPDLRAAVHASLKALDLDRDDVLAAVDLLWAEPVLERRTAAAVLLVQRHLLLEFEDLALVERLVREAGARATVDVLAGEVAGELLARFDNASGSKVLDRWAVDPDAWVRRSALLAHGVLLRDDDATWPRFARYADAMLEQRESVVREAIGHVLHDVARRDPGRVFEWILPRAHRTSDVTAREAVKYLTADQAAAVTAGVGR